MSTNKNDICEAKRIRVIGNFLHGVLKDGRTSKRIT